MNTSDTLFQLLSRIPNLLPYEFQKYHQISKYGESDRTIRNKKWPKEWSEIYYKGYPRFKAYSLPQASNLRDAALQDAYFKRISAKQFSKAPCTVSETSDLLYFGAGEFDSPYTALTKRRFYPSAGARYPLEVYPIVLQHHEIPPGIYHYYVRGHAIEVLPQPKNIKKLLYQSIDQPFVKKASMVFAVSAVFDRTSIKYQERAYRLALMEAGHMCQNFYTTSAALGIGCCALGGFNDDTIHNLFGLDGISESILILMAFGHTD